MSKILTIMALGVSMAFAGLGTAPARADDRTGAFILGAITGAILKDSLDRDRRHDVRPQYTRPDKTRIRDHRWRERFTPHRPRDRVKRHHRPRYDHRNAYRSPHTRYRDRHYRRHDRRYDRRYDRRTRQTWTLNLR